MPVTPELLRFFDLLKSLPEELVQDLADCSSIKKLARREVLYEADESPENLSLLFEGRLQGVDFTIDGREVGLYFIEPGDFCGELTISDGGTQPEFIIALSYSVVVLIPYTAVLRVMGKDPAITQAISLKLAKRVRQLTAQRSLLGIPNTSQRVCRQLLALISNENNGANCSHIVNPPTHKEIAIMLSSSRESVSRTFQILQNQQIIKRDGQSRLIIRDVDALTRLADGAVTPEELGQKQGE